MTGGVRGQGIVGIGRGGEHDTDPVVEHRSLRC